MKKYLTIFRINWQNSLQYRASTVIYILGYGLFISVLLYLWISVYQDGHKMGNYSVSDLMTYYVLQLVMNTLILSYISWNLIDLIREGFFSNFLVKPIDSLFYWFTINVSSKLLEAIYISITLGGLYFFLGDYFLFPRHLATYFYFSGSLLLALILAFLLDFCIALIAFWLIQVRVFKFMLQYLIFFFAGAILPLDLFPAWLQGFVHLLPFQYIVFFPIQVYLEKETVLAANFAAALTWILFFYGLAKIMLAKGIKKNEAAGG